jgi:hypothetical protein
MECPVCGLTLPRQPLPAPLLFQASALRPGQPTAAAFGARVAEPGQLGLERPGPGQEHRGSTQDYRGPDQERRGFAQEALPPPRERPTLATPALGRVEPLTLLEHLETGGDGPMPELPALPEPTQADDRDDGPSDSFWPVVKMEGLEFLLLAALNGVIALVAFWTAGSFSAKVYAAFWPYILPVHAAVSWTCLMVPLVLVGQSPMMGVQGLLLDTDLPERRMSFSVLYLVSAACFPVSFFCMVLTRDHRTLGELLSGQEILQLPSYRER